MRKVAKDNLHGALFVLVDTKGYPQTLRSVIRLLNPLLYIRPYILPNTLNPQPRILLTLNLNPLDPQPQILNLHLWTPIWRIAENEFEVLWTISPTYSPSSHGDSCLSGP